MSDSESLNGETSNVVDAQRIILSPGNSSPAPPRHVPVAGNDSTPPPYFKEVRGNCDLDINKHSFLRKMCFLFFSLLQLMD